MLPTDLFVSTIFEFVGWQVTFFGRQAGNLKKLLFQLLGYKFCSLLLIAKKV